MNQSRLYELFRFIHRLSNWRRWGIVKKLRGWYYSQILGCAGKGLKISSGARINNPAMISVGENCYIGADVQLYPWKERITMGNNVLVAAGVRMITRKHGFANLDIPISDQGYTNAPIVIEDGVWIGFQAVILPDVTIGKGSIIGAGAVVTKDGRTLQYNGRYPGPSDSQANGST